jgi:hypothetical protein
MQELREQFMDQQKVLMTDLVSQYERGGITIQALTDNIKQVLKDTYIDMYVMGKGGRNMMTQADWGSIGGMLREQYRYLDRLMAQVAAGEISFAQLNARLGMYVNSANEALWRGYNSDLPFSLPAYPGDGSTPCLTNCQCEWNIVQVEGGYDCYWRLGEAEHCPVCQERAHDWNPWRWPGTRQT